LAASGALIQEVWDYAWEISGCDVHIGQIRKKIGNDATQPADQKTVRGVAGV